MEKKEKVSSIKYMTILNTKYPKHIFSTIGC